MTQPLSLFSFLEASNEELPALYEALFARIEKEDPTLCVFTDQGWNPQRVREDLCALLDRYPEKSSRPPLFGVPVGVKDVFRVEGYTVRAGSLLPGRLFAGSQAGLVTKLKDLGAIVIGITASTEFAHAEPAATRNPLNLEHTPGGSSSGSAAGVAAGFFPLALGTQTMGSVVRPASFCGIVGFKPGQNSLPQDGIIPFAPEIDQPGFFCRTPKEAAYVVEALFPQECAHQHWRIGIPTGAYLEEAEPETCAVFQRWVEALASQPGVEIIPVDCFPQWSKIAPMHRNWAYAQFALVQKEWFARFAPLYRPRTQEAITTGFALGSTALRLGRQCREEVKERLSTLLTAQKIDCFAAPATPGVAPHGIAGTGDPILDIPWTMAGVPVVCLPMGRGAQGLPLGVQIAAGWGEEKLLAQFLSTFPATLP